MSMQYGVHTVEDAKEAAVIHRRQRVEQERKLRIFDPRVRTCGKDVEALKRQIEEKRAREVQEKQRMREYETENYRHQLVAKELDERVHQIKRKLHQDLLNYRENYQRYEDRREFDLNDPKAIKNSYPARLHDEDPRLTSCGMQVFDGEDLRYKERIKIQSLESRACLAAQIEDKRRTECEIKQAEAIYDQRVHNSELRNYQLMLAERDAQRAVNKALADFNLTLANETKERRQLNKLAEDEAEMAHKLNMCQSELLTETVDATSVNGAHRVNKDHFKGYGKERIASIREFQLGQILERKNREKEEASREKAWVDLAHRLDVHGLMVERSLTQRKKEKNTDFSTSNVMLSREQRLREEYRNRILYTQTPSEDFFQQFNTTTR